MLQAPCVSGILVSSSSHHTPAQGPALSGVSSTMNPHARHQDVRRSVKMGAERLPREKLHRAVQSLLARGWCTHQYLLGYIVITQSYHGSL